ncbi:unnamed protein product [Diabrotica balteata]|uniref:C2H2-type domain-containing protein n=1 Tax=Diabrotica balteata TaxID=107213 RepID=A0A9N9T482_DIABA|nr:unnamed protein product [Diabrotica balteata]
MSEQTGNFNDGEESIDHEEIDYVSPEIIYLEDNGDTSELKGFTHLGPLVEYIYDENAVVEYNDHQYTELDYATQDNSEHIQDTCSTEINDDSSDLIQPMMPFFLSSQVFAAGEEQDPNDGETIILQVENEEEEVDQRTPIPDEVRSSTLQLLLCSSKSNSVLDTYTCEVCSISYGCLNCLKSHYETMHLGNTFIAHYKCKYSTHISKGLCCPVCELTFNTKSETMDHYITHAVACDICGSGFDRQQYLSEHRRKVHNKGDFDVIYDCEICRGNFQYPSGLSKHYQKTHKIILCVECKVRCGDQSELIEHEKMHKQKADVLPYACSKCDKAFAEISEIAVHIRQDHNHKRKQQFETVYVISQIKADNKQIKNKVVRIQ